ncbi:magnesium transporter CorA family protein [Yimella sp. cx-573]|nr:magnesium transporter CorA family protein [Yimella sp. cx-573]
MVANGSAQLNCRVWRDGELVAQIVRRDEILESLRDPTTLVWLDLVDASPAHLEPLIEALNLPPTEVEDAFARHERPKVSRHGDHLFFTAYSAGLVGADRRDAHQDHLEVHRISGFMLPAALVTIRGSDFDMEPVLRTWDDNADLLQYGPRALVHGLMDTIVDGHFATIQTLDDQIERLEDVLFEADRTGPHFLREVYAMRKNLVALRRVVLPMREVVNGLLRHAGRTNTELDSWFDDLYDHILRAAEWTESLRDMVTSLFETNLSLQDARLNTTMRQLAAWAAIIAVPTAITGWFGQNVPYPGFSKPAGLWMSAALIVVLSSGLWWTFRKRGWLGRSL